jgi:hypothetical protein
MTVRLRFLFAAAVLSAALAACGCVDEGIASLVNRERLARRLGEHVPQEYHSDLPWTADLAARADVWLVPGGIVLQGGYDVDDPNFARGPELFYADGRHIATAGSFATADVTGDAVRDFIVLEVCSLLDGYQYSVYPLGGDCKPIRGFALASLAERCMPQIQVGDVDNDGIAEVITVQTNVKSLVGKGWFDEAAWQRYYKEHPEAYTAAVVWSFRQGVARPILMFTEDYEYRLLPGFSGFLVSTKPFYESPGIPEWARWGPSKGPWFEVRFDKAAGAFSIPPHSAGPLFLCNGPLAGTKANRDRSRPGG